MIISLSGYMGSGKDTAGTIIKDLLHEYSDTSKGFTYWHDNEMWSIKKWAGPLRKVAAILLGMDEEFLYTEEFKQMVLPECWSRKYVDVINHYSGSYNTWPESFDEGQKLILMSGREFLQKLGTDAIRNGLHENAWVNALMGEYKSPDLTLVNYPNWIITDTRFPNELQAVKDRGGITIRIKRYIDLRKPELVEEGNKGIFRFPLPHPSETALDKYSLDYTVENNGTIEELTNKLKTILKQENLL